MRDVPNWPTNTDALAPIVRVTHRGSARDVEGVTISRTLPSTVPEQVARVGGITQATASVSWSTRNDVEEVRATGFNRAANWPPAVRDAVQISTGYRTDAGDLLVRQITGSVLSSDGDPQSATSSQVVDPIARLSRKVNLPPLLNNMPPLTEGGPWRGVGIYPTFFTDRAARAGSFFSTPGMGGGCVFSVPLMGSTWPERGTLHTGLLFTDRNSADLRFVETPWGLGVRDAFLGYTPSGNTTLDRPMELTAMVPASPPGERAFLATKWGTEDIRISFRSGNVWGMVDGTIVCNLPYVEGYVHTLRVERNGGTLTLTLRDSGGREATGTASTPAEVSGGMTEVYVVSEAVGSPIGGAQVSFPTTAWTSVNYTRSAYITPSTYNATLQASPPIQDETARSLLEAQSRAELAGLWIDGDGALHWMNRLRLQGQTPAATLTSKDNLLSLPWAEDFSSVSSQVEVASRKPEAVLQSKWPQFEVWRSNYSRVEADGSEVFEELIHPPADEDWIMVDRSFNNDYTDANRMRGSDIGLYYFMEVGTEGDTGYQSVEGYSRDWAGATLTLVDHTTYKLVTRVYRVTTASWDDYEFSLQIPTERQSSIGGAWHAALGGMNFPVIRAHGKVMWIDVTYTASDDGPWDAPVMSHDVGWWVQDAGECQAIANYLARHTKAAQPYLSGVDVVPDARLERGDVVTLIDTDLTGVEYRCLVVGIEDRLSGTPPTWDQTCDFRVIDYKTTTP